MLIDYGMITINSEIVLFDPKMPYEHRMAVLQPAIISIELIKVEKEWDFPS